MEQQTKFRPLSIFLLEDSDADAKLMELALEEVKIEYQLEILKSPEVLLQALENLKLSNNIDTFLPLFLLDLEVPRVSGLELIESIRHEFKKSQVPVVVYSGSQNHQSILSAYLLGANAYLFKSINYTETLDHLNAMLRYFLRMYG